MAQKKATIRVDISEAFHQQNIDVGAVLDMLRYFELLKSNEPGFPKFIAYDTKLVAAQDQIDRWKSFGYEAKLIGW